MERSIKIAINIKTGEIVNADLIFQTQIEGQEIRKIDKQTLGDDFCCYECGQFLETSSKNKNVFFKHKKGHSPCVFTDEDINPKEVNDFIFMNKLKEESQENYNGTRSHEGERHYNLKEQIATKLKKTVCATDVQKEKTIRNDLSIKRADVYCKFDKKEIVFEIQISKLSARYLLDRHNFYKSNGIYLIWILDVNVKYQDQFSIDIKYLNEYENFFKLDEKIQTFKLICHYKEAILNQHNEIRTPWKSESIELMQLNFNKVSLQPYYYDLKNETQKKEKIRLQRNEESKKLAEQLVKEQLIKEQLIHKNWQNNWVSSFKLGFQDLANSRITNSKGTIILFAQHDLTKNEMIAIENQAESFIWVVNANNIHQNFELKEILPFKLDEFNRTYINEFQKNINNINQELANLKQEKLRELSKIQKRIEFLENEKVKLNQELEEKKDYAKSILNLLWDERNTNNKFQEFISAIKIIYKEKIQEYKNLIIEHKKQIKENNENIKLWESFKGSIIKDKILQQLPSTEINKEKLSGNVNFILVRDIQKERLTGSTELNQLGEYNIDEILTSSKDYTFYTDYSIKIKDWKDNNVGFESDIENLWGKLHEEQNKIESEFMLWIENLIATLNDKIQKEKKIESEINVELINSEHDIDRKLKCLDEEKETYKQNLINGFKLKHEFYWKSNEIVWQFSKRPVFFEISGSLYWWYYEIENEATHIEKNKFISFYNK